MGDVGARVENVNLIFSKELHVYVSSRSTLHINSKRTVTTEPGAREFDISPSRKAV